jgi:hypothetical protein
MAFLGICDYLGYAVGCIHVPYDDSCRCTPDDADFLETSSFQLGRDPEKVKE